MDTVTVSVHLFTNDVPFDPPPTLDDIVEAAWPGYEPVHGLTLPLPVDHAEAGPTRKRFDVVFRREPSGGDVVARGFFVVITFEGERSVLVLQPFSEPRVLPDQALRVQLTVQLAAFPVVA